MNKKVFALLCMHLAFQNIDATKLPLIVNNQIRKMSNTFGVNPFTCFSHNGKTTKIAGKNDFSRVMCGCDKNDNCQGVQRLFDLYEDKQKSNQTILICSIFKTKDFTKIACKIYDMQESKHKNSEEYEKNKQNLLEKVYEAVNGNSLTDEPIDIVTSKK